ncbi:MAG: NAD-dependent epimerase/dehydratase family protein [Acidobacteriota bacterium]|nr:NAD-dependent epimerase/dehydratase family protein [Acidobacteriota bacterium]
MSEANLRLIRDVAQLEEALSRPSPADVDFMRTLSGDVMVLGAGGKMGPSLAKLARRSATESGVPRNILAVSRFSSQMARDDLETAGVQTFSGDLMTPGEVDRLPDCANVLYLAGRKFGSAGRPDLTWATNAVLPAWVAQRFKNSRIVAFSTGNVYPFSAVPSRGSRESDHPAPVGEYAQSCLARERVFEYYSRENDTPCVLLRLNYAVDLRYGVLSDIGRKVFANQPVDLGVPSFNVIWQGDANSYALRALGLCSCPPFALNVTWAESLSVRAVAEYFARRFQKPCRFQSVEGASALLSDASLCFSVLGQPTISSERLLELQADWIESGGVALGKPTHFEVSDGKF